MDDRFLQDLHVLWESLRAGRLAPFRAELAVRLGGALQHHCFDLEGHGEDIIAIRKPGAKLAEMIGTETHGKPAVSLMRTESRAHLVRAMRQVLSLPATARINLRAHDHDGKTGSATMLLLPLRSDFGLLDRMIACISLAPGHFRAPLEFSLVDVQISAIQETRHDSPALPGFAEAQAGFQLGEAPPLREVSGNPSALRGLSRGKFRVIKGGQD